jgi:hypothetical protein
LALGEKSSNLRYLCVFKASIRLRKRNVIRNILREKVAQNREVLRNSVSHSERALDINWANDALKFGIRTCRGFEWSIPKPRFILVRYLIWFLHEEKYFWHEKKLKSAFFRALKDKSIFFHGHRNDVVNSAEGADSSSSEERRRAS